ncbi:MAG TPA: GAF domain-containing protein [Myxococcota bacterium]|nr:GAF domain-containing protein [Myxococcota bacterium]
MKRRLAIVGVTDEVLELLALLEARPELEIAAVFDADLAGARARLGRLPAARAAALAELLTDDPARLDAQQDLFAVVDAGASGALPARFPNLARRGVQVLTPLTARLLFGPGAAAPDRKQELLQALHEIVESVDLTVDPDQLCARVLEVTVEVTAADGGSLMLLDPESRVLRMRCAIGIEPELWDKIRVPLGEGIAGGVAATGRAVALSGRADHAEYPHARERLDVEASLCVPLAHDGKLLGVLNLHHRTRPDAFSEDDLRFAEELGRLDAAILARAQERETLSRSAARYDAVREVREALSARSPLLERLTDLCRRVAARSGGGIATVYLFDPEEKELRLAATSLAGGGFAGEYRVLPGQGVDGLAAQKREPVFLRAPDGALAYAALPLLHRDQLVGVLSVQSGASPAAAPQDRAYPEALLEIAAAAADEIADAERETRMAARASQMSAIHDAGMRLLSSRDVAEVVRLATSSGALILAADHAILRLQDDATRRYVIRSYYGSAEGHEQEKLFRLDKRVSVEAIKRRSPCCQRDLPAPGDPLESGVGVHSLLAAPLREDARVIGTLCLYEKGAADRFYPSVFGDEDLRVFAKWVSYVERALAQARFLARTRQHRSFDEETGLPNASYLLRRVGQEVARAAQGAGSLAVILCRLENLAEIRSAADPIRADRVVLRATEALQRQLRDFDVLARAADCDFAALLPDPGPDPDEHIYTLARRVAEVVARDEALNEPVRVALAFGYAVYPRDGADAASLLEHASQVRIRML